MLAQRGGREVKRFLKNHRDFWKIIEGGTQDFLAKMGGNPYGKLSIEGAGDCCFSLVMYEFCSSNALYSGIFAFTMFFLLLTSFYTRGCYYFE